MDTAFMELPEDLDMADLKPTNKYVAKAVPREKGGFNAVWAAPGMVPDFVFMNDEPQIFTEAWQAEAKAREVLFDALNSRPTLSHSNRSPSSLGSAREVKFVKMTGADFAQALSWAGVAPSEFAYFWGTSLRRVDDWMKGGTDEVPFPVRWALALLKNSRNFELVRTIVDQNVKPKD